MHTIHRPPAILAVVALVVGACAAAGASPVATPAPPASPSMQAAASATASPPPTASPAPSSAAPASTVPSAPADPKGPARVNGSGPTSVINPGVTKTDPDGRIHVSGVVIESSFATSDPRVNGKATVKVAVEGVGDVGWETATVLVTNSGGRWDGTCQGATWSAGNASDISCWLVGKGAYQGLTFYYHVVSTGPSSTLDGLILPLAAPKTTP